MRHAYGGWLAAGLAWLVVDPAAAELFRCQGADGRTIYTDQKDTCPGAKPFEPSGVVLSAPTPAPPTPVSPAEPAPTGPANATPAAPAHNPLADEAEASMAQHWRDKKQEALDQIAQLEQRREWMRKYVNHCNRGGYVTTRDDAGIKQVVNCSELRREFAALEDQEAAKRAYLDEGLREECRKAGCLPGWIR